MCIKIPAVHSGETVLYKRQKLYLDEVIKSRMVHSGRITRSENLNNKVRFSYYRSHADPLRVNVFTVIQPTSLIHSGDRDDPQPLMTANLGPYLLNATAAAAARASHMALFLPFYIPGFLHSPFSPALQSSLSTPAQQ